MKEIASCIRAIGENLIALSDAFLLMQTHSIETTETKDSTESTEPKKLPPEKLTLEILRELLGGLAANGHSDEVAALLKKYGTGKLSSVPEEKYSLLYKEAKGLQPESALQGSQCTQNTQGGRSEKEVPNA